MGKTIKLFVYLNTRYVGDLIQSTSGAMSFKYSDEWISQFSDYGISLSLPVQETEYKGAEVFNFFDNLLPDNNQIRKSVAEKVQAKSSRTFDLLSAVGRDCVGALRFMSQKLEIKDLEDAAGEELTGSQIEEILGHLKSFPLGMGEHEFRLSIAGAQEKTALLKMNNKWLLPKESTPTTHIFKPPMGQLQNGIDLRTSVENEWLCLKLCEFFGLEVAQTHIETFASKKCLVVERFDRVFIEKNKLVRIPQEDICQALKYSPTKKYENDGGPGIVEIMDFLNASLNRDEDRYHFMKIQILFWLMGATDGHAKNYSVFIKQDGFILTPFYDVMSMYPALKENQVNLRDMRLSFKVGNSRHDRMDKIKIRHFYETANKCGFSANEVDRILVDIKSKTKEDFINLNPMPEGFSQSVWNSIIDETFTNFDKL